MRGQGWRRPIGLACLLVGLVLAASALRALMTADTGDVRGTVGAAMSILGAAVVLLSTASRRER